MKNVQAFYMPQKNFGFFTNFSKGLSPLKIQVLSQKKFSEKCIFLKEF